MHYELIRTFLFWRWLVPTFGEGRALTKGGAKRAAEALIARIKKTQVSASPDPRLPTAVHAPHPVEGFVP